MSSDRELTAVKVGAGVATIVSSIVFMIVAIVRHHRKRKSGGGAKGKVPSMSDIRKWYRAALDKIVAARVEKESSTEFGEPIFLSHYIDRGQFRHWVLHAHGHKYELRQAQREEADQKRYAAAIAPSGFDLKAYKQSVITRYSPAVGYYFYSMMGWTTLSKEQVDEACGRVSTNFGRYTVLSNNCHDFLQRLADKIVTTKAPDWDWFRRNNALSLGSYNYVHEQPPLPYQVISAAQHFERLKHYLDTTERQEIENFIVTLQNFIEAHMNQVMIMSLAAAASVAANGGGGQNDGGGGGAC